LEVFFVKKLRVLFLVCLLLFIGSGVAGAQYSDTFLKIEGDPLEIWAANEGTMAAYYQGQYQYYQSDDNESSWGSVLVLDGGSESFPTYVSEEISDWMSFPDDRWEYFTPVSHGKVDAWTIRTVYRAGDSGVEITQTIAYTNGSSYYRKSWVIKNNSDRTYTDVRFTHGGDAYFGGDDESLGHWDPSLRMVYLTNPDPAITGIMGFYGASSSPADHYYEGSYSDVFDYMSLGQLPDTVRDDYHDSGYALQWNRAGLAPGESWTIVAYEKWTAAGLVQVLAPPDRQGAPGETISYTFTLANEGDQETVYNLTAGSSSGWNTSLESSTLTIPAGQTASVAVELTIAPGAAVGTKDILTLTATAADDDSVTNSDSVTTEVIPPKTGSLTVTIEPAAAVAAGVQWRRTGTTTWFNSGATESGIPVGTYTIEFKEVPGFEKLDAIEVAILQDQTVSAAAIFFPEPPKTEGPTGPEPGNELPSTDGGGGLLNMVPAAIMALAGALILKRKKR